MSLYTFLAAKRNLENENRKNPNVFRDAKVHGFNRYNWSKKGKVPTKSEKGQDRPQKSESLFQTFPGSKKGAFIPSRKKGV